MKESTTRARISVILPAYNEEVVNASTVATEMGMEALVLSMPSIQEIPTAKYEEIGNHTADAIKLTRLHGRMKQRRARVCSLQELLRRLNSVYFRRYLSKGLIYISLRHS